MQKWKYDDVILERFILGMLEVNCYLLSDEDSAVLIDPGFGEDDLARRVESLNNLPNRLVLLTHGHFDHTGFCPRLQKMGWKVGIHPEDKFLLNRIPPDFAGLGYNDEPLDPYLTFMDGWSFNIGSTSLDVVHTPGHSPGSVCFIDHRKRFAFTGDTLFADSIGRTDLRGGNYKTIMLSLEKLRGLLEPDTIVMSGHGGRALFSKVLKINPFLHR